MISWGGGLDLRARAGVGQLRGAAGGGLCCVTLSLLSLWYLPYLAGLLLFSLPTGLYVLSCVSLHDSCVLFLISCLDFS